MALMQLARVVAYASIILFKIPQPKKSCKLQMMMLARASDVTVLPIKLVSVHSPLEPPTESTPSRLRDGHRAANAQHPVSGQGGEPPLRCSMVSRLELQ